MPGEKTGSVSTFLLSRQIAGPVAAEPVRWVSHSPPIYSSRDIIYCETHVHDLCGGHCTTVSLATITVATRYVQDLGKFVLYE